MKAEQRELYVYTKDHFADDLSKISPECISPIIAVRQVIQKAIKAYVTDYCTANENPFSKEDFQTVSNIIRDEIMSEKENNIEEETKIMSTIYQKAVGQMKPEDIAHWQSDLYLRKNKVSDALVSEYEFKQHVKTFIDNIEHVPFYEIPFAYDPHYQKKEL